MKALTIRRLRPSDAEALYRILSDRQVMRYLEPPYDRLQTEQFLREAGLAEPPLVYGAEEGGRLLGYVIYHAYDPDSMELGWVLSPDCWGKGYASRLTDRLVDYANDHGVELLLLAGDLFDSDQLYGQTAQELARSLARFRGHAVIAPGNHDFYAASNPYARLLWPENVHIFREERLQRLPFPQYGCVVYGAAFTSPDAPAGIPGSLGPEDEGLARILLLHGEVGVRDSRYRAMTLKDVEQSGADYLALGHVHAFGGVQQAGRTFWAYPGCPEGRGFDELGDKGFLTGTVEPGQVKLTFVPFARRRYQWLTADVTGTDPLEALRRELPPHPETDIFRMVLTGETEEPPRLDALYDALSPDCFYLELQDRTTRCRDLWEHCGEDTLRGLFLRDLRQRYDAAPEEEKPRLLQAARFGLAALENREL